MRGARNGTESVPYSAAFGLLPKFDVKTHYGSLGATAGSCHNAGPRSCITLLDGPAVAPPWKKANKIESHLLGCTLSVYWSLR